MPGQDAHPSIRSRSGVSSPPVRRTWALSFMLFSERSRYRAMSTPTTFDADRPSGGSWHALPRTMTARLNATTPAVLDVQLRSGVAGLRGLGRAGLGPVALGRSWADAGLWSRHALSLIHI